MALCPESPAWLARAGRPADAVRALRRLHGSAFRIQDYPKLQQAYIVLDGEEAEGAAPPAPDGGALQQPLLASEQGGDNSGNGGSQGQPEGAHLGWAALRRPEYRRVMVLAAALPLAQQASGINTVIFYSSQVRCDFSVLFLTCVFWWGHVCGAGRAMPCRLPHLTGCTGARAGPCRFAMCRCLSRRG